MRVVAPTFLAEVSDKMMSIPVLLLWNATIILVAWWLVRRSRWLTLIPLSVALIFALAPAEELRDPHICPAVIHEFGYHYVAFSFLPLLAVVLLMVKGGEIGLPSTLWLRGR